MKKIILSLIIFGLFQLSYSQKKELKTIDKQIKSGEYENALNTINSIKSLVDIADDKTKAKYYFLLGKALYAEGEASFSNIKKSIENFKFSLEFNSDSSNKSDAYLQNIYSSFLEKYNVSNTNEDFANAYQYIESAYRIYEKDTSFLFNAALIANQAKLYQESIKHYKELIDLEYKGIETIYVADDKETGETIIFPKEQWSIIRLSDEYKNYRDSITKSLEVNIYRQLSSVYKKVLDYKNSIKYLDEALEKNQNDINILLDKATIYVETEDWVNYELAVNRVLEIDPNNYLLLCNLAIVNKEKGNLEDAFRFISRAIEIDDKNPRALKIAGEIILQPVDKLREELFSINPFKEEKRYDSLDKKIKDIISDSIRYFEMAFQLESDEFLIDQLKILHSILGNTEKEMFYKGLQE